MGGGRRVRVGGGDGAREAEGRGEEGEERGAHFDALEGQDRGGLAMSTLREMGY